MKKIDKVLGKHKSTQSCNNYLFIKEFEEGVKIRIRGQSEISINKMWLYYLLNQLKKYGNLHNAGELDLIKMQYPETFQFITRLQMDKISYEEMEEIRKNHINKLKLADAIEEKGIK